MEEKRIIIIAVLFLAIIGVIRSCQKIQYHRTINTLISMDLQEITMFRIYPRVIRPVGSPVEFKAPDPIIEGFFQSLTDIRPYKPSHDTVASWDHSWFLEVTTEGIMIQIDFHIPSGKGSIVTGKLGKFIEGGGGPLYGDFQSRKLYQWYQNYSHRWLSPSAETE
jgi:hypothetical protein